MYILIQEISYALIEMRNVFSNCVELVLRLKLKLTQNNQIETNHICVFHGLEDFIHDVLWL